MKALTEGLPWTAMVEMERYYRDRVPWHDEYMGYEGNTATEELLSPIIEHVEGHIEDRDVLEVACGTGNWTQVLSRRARTVKATDLVPGYLKIARGKAHPRANVVFEEADAYALETVAGDHDAAFASDWRSHTGPCTARSSRPCTGGWRLEPASYWLT